MLLKITNWLMMNMNDSMSFNMEIMNKFYDQLILIMLMIMIFISYMMISTIFNKMTNKMMMENQMLEFIWTLIPLMMIIYISISSMKIISFNNEQKINIMNLKIMGNQWFWIYEYMNLNIKFNSYLNNKELFNFFNLETDNKIILPFMYNIQLIMTSLDVIHSWTIPSLNMKIDCIPNQINQMKILINKPSILFGQCSEICGMNHSFMPIMIESIEFSNFLKWIKSSLNNIWSFKSNLVNIF